MRYVDMESWPRREHFRHFSSFNHPHFGLIANVDVTALRAYLRRHPCSFTVAVVYIIARTANGIPEFRMRIRDGRVVEHAQVDPSFTAAAGNDLFGFCAVPYREDFAEFSLDATRRMEAVKVASDPLSQPDRDDVLYVTALPWVAFTSLTHPMSQHPADSIPRFAFGKVFGDQRLRQMPLGVQGHHALMDGVHIGRFYSQFQDYLSFPDSVLT